MADRKVKVGILGTGNIGGDLLVKVLRSDILECGIFSGINIDSPGIKRAEKMGVRISADSIRAIENDPDCCEIVFDATSARTHFINAPILEKLNKFVIDLTPSRIGKMCVPVMNIDQSLGERNINMVTCGGQAAVPIAAAIMQVHPDTQYIEVVASIASKSAGAGTRANIDEYSQTTKEAIEFFSGVPRAKAIIILNPAEPPVLMHNTIYAQINNPDLAKLKKEIFAVAEKIQQYVPGYKIKLGPVADNGRVTVIIEVVGRGDYLPQYSGNLDIITCAAVQVAEQWARKHLGII